MQLKKIFFGKKKHMGTKNHKIQIKKMEVTKLPIHKDYCRDWVIIDALREIISNALDTKTKVSIKKIGKEFHIIDRGKGISQKHLLLGLSKNKNIGQFGEGLKIAVLILLRNGFDIQIETVGRTYIPKLEEEEEFENEIITKWYHCPNKRTKGTEIVTNVGDKDIQQAKKLFAIYTTPELVEENDFGKIYKNFDNEGTIYLRGVVVQNIGKSLFSYEITDKKLVGRDRKAIDERKLKFAAKKILKNAKLKDVITKYYDNINNPDIWENEMTFTPTYKEIWGKFSKEAFEKRVLISNYNDVYDRKVKEEGFQIINPDKKVRQTLINIGILTSDKKSFEIDREKVQKSEPIPFKELLEFERRNWMKAIKISERIFKRKIDNIYVIKVSSLFWNEGGHTYGDKIFIKRDQLKNLSTLTGTIIHECIHKFYGYEDCTRDFENKLTEICGNLAIK